MSDAVMEGEQQHLAMVAGQPLMNLPEDLYIPPDALEVVLETFEGPLDLLLYLIRRQNLDILNIPIVEITRQYVSYIELMDNIKLELAGEYLVMAAMLAEIKSRMLLPKQVDEDGEEDDPRAELIRRLREYEQFKQAAEDLDTLPRYERDIFVANAMLPDWEKELPVPDVEYDALISAFRDVLKRTKVREHHMIARESLSIRERMTMILARVQQSKFISFAHCFTPSEGRLGVVVTFVAMLELLRQSTIQMVQGETFGPIHLKAV